jgi:hypothetical protein
MSPPSKGGFDHSFPAVPVEVFKDTKIVNPPWIMEGKVFRFISNRNEYVGQGTSLMLMLSSLLRKERKGGANHNFVAAPLL